MRPIPSLALILMTSACSVPSSDNVAQPANETATASATEPQTTATEIPDVPSPSSPDDSAIANQPITSENYGKVMEARSREYDRMEYKPVTLTGFESGDNSYVKLERHIEGAAEETILCTARQCAEWRDAGGLPAVLRNRKVEVKLGRADQVDGADRVINRNVVAVIEIRVPA